MLGSSEGPLTDVTMPESEKYSLLLIVPLVSQEAQLLIVSRHEAPWALFVSVFF